MSDNFELTLGGEKAAAAEEITLTLGDAPATPAPAAAPQAAGEVVPSPLPGTVLQVKVSAGEAVKAGQLLLVIEAMKMENEILAPRDGTVAQVVAAKGATVNTGDALVVLS